MALSVVDKSLGRKAIGNGNSCILNLKDPKQKEKQELEKIKCAFLRNQADLKGRRWAITETDLLNQTKNMRIYSKLLRQLSGKDDDWELSEIKRIVLYQIRPKRRLSLSLKQI